MANDLHWVSLHSRSFHVPGRSSVTRKSTNSNRVGEKTTTTTGSSDMTASDLRACFHLGIHKCLPEEILSDQELDGMRRNSCKTLIFKWAQQVHGAERGRAWMKCGTGELEHFRSSHEVWPHSDLGQQHRRRETGKSQMHCEDRMDTGWLWRKRHR